MSNIEEYTEKTFESIYIYRFEVPPISIEEKEE